VVKDVQEVGEGRVGVVVLAIVNVLGDVKGSGRWGQKAGVEDAETQEIAAG